MENISTTTLLCSNIHCPSCVKTIEETLRQFGDATLEVSTSTVTQIVLIKHHKSLPSQTLARCLYDAGFDVQSLWEQRGHSRASLFPLAWLSPGADTTTPATLSSAFQDFSCGMIQSPEQNHAHRALHNQNCLQCASSTRAERTDSKAELTVHAEEQEHPLDELLVVSSQPQKKREYNVVISLEGMTCSACVGRVTEVLETNSCVKKVNVNLLSQSATLVVDDPSKVDELVSDIEDIGYEAALESCEPITTDGMQDRKAQNASSVVTGSRTVMIKVQDMYCEHCPAKILAALENLHENITVKGDLTYSNGLLIIDYTPRAPDFTIRHILDSIRRADDHFHPTIYEPPSLEERALKLQHKHQRYLLGRLIIAVLAAIPTLAWGVVIMSLLPSENATRRFWMDTWVGGRIQAVQLPLLVLATIVYFASAEVFHRRALRELYMMWRPSSKVPILRRFYRFGSMDMLLSLGTTVAYVGSIVVLIMEAVDRTHTASSMPESSSTTTTTTTYFDAVVFLTMFLLIGRLLEAYGKAKTADAVSALTKLRPREALLLVQQGGKNEGSVEQYTQAVPLDELDVGDTVVVPPGAAPPCDGSIVFGTTSFDESSLTGESKAIARGVGDTAFAGTINLSSAVHIQLTSNVGTSMLDSIVDTVREGQAKRAPIERFADILTGYFVPLIVLIALLDWLIWILLGYGGVLNDVQASTGGWVFWSLRFAVAVLVVACPCGIGLAAPTALFVATGLAAKRGILAKGGGEAFQEASDLDCVIFDKTGTITEGGNPIITDSLWMLEDGEADVRAAMLLLESHSTHPLAVAISEFCKNYERTANVRTTSVKELPGLGMVGSFQTTADTALELFVGSEKLLQEHDIFLTPQMVKMFRQWSAEAKTVVFVGMRNSSRSPWQAAAMLAAWDPVRPEAARVIKALKEKQIDVWLLSGDNADTARAVADSVGLAADHVIAGVLPNQKAEKVQMLQRISQKVHGKGSNSGSGRRRATVAMVGDGINDAPALAMADVGIAMGSGSDTAISSADFVLLTSDLQAVLTLVKLSKVVLRRVRFNFAWAIGYNLIMLPFAAGALYPIISNGSHVRLDPVWASLAMALSSISVVLSSLLLKTRLPVVGFRSA